MDIATLSLTLKSVVRWVLYLSVLIQICARIGPEASRANDHDVTTCIALNCLTKFIFGGTYHSDSNKKLFVVFEGELSSRLGCEKKAGVPSMVLQSKQFFSGY